MVRVAWIAGWALMLSACTGFEPHPDWVQAPEPGLLQRTLEGEALFGRPVRLAELPEDDLFALSPAMKSLAEELKYTHRNPEARVTALHHALLQPPSRGGLGIRYSAYVTKAAAEAFAEREVNCLSFSLIFVAMSRQMGLEAKVNEVDIPPMWDLRDGDSLTFFRHVNAKVVMPQGHQLVADLEMERYGAHYRQRMISDEQAAAQYYNNRAMELLASAPVESHEVNKAVTAKGAVVGDSVAVDTKPVKEAVAEQVLESYLHLRKGLELNPEAPYLWSNLGNLYGREGLYPEAEAAYLKGLSLDPRDLTLISNLAHLYSLKGDALKANYFSGRAQAYRESNPYYLYALALEALSRSDLEQAEQLILKSLEKEAQEPRFYRLAAQIYEHQERPLQARKMLDQMRSREER